MPDAALELRVLSVADRVDDELLERARHAADGKKQREDGSHSESALHSSRH